MVQECLWRESPLALLSAWQIQCPTQRCMFFTLPDRKQKKAENVFRGKYQAGANRIKGQALHLNGKPRKIFFSDLSLCSRINLSKSDPYIPQTKKKQMHFLFIVWYLLMKGCVATNRKHFDKNVVRCHLEKLYFEMIFVACGNTPWSLWCHLSLESLCATALKKVFASKWWWLQIQENRDKPIK